MVGRVGPLAGSRVVEEGFAAGPWVCSWVEGGGSAEGSRITGRAIPRAVLSWAVFEQQKEVSPVQQSAQAELGQSVWLHGKEGLSLTLYEHTQQNFVPGMPVWPAQAIFLCC